MNRPIELLAPGGDLDSIKAAILAGADAVYCGLERFNARNRASNISFENLQGIVRLAHKNDCKIFVTLNIIILDSEIPAIIKLLNKLVNTKIDGVIVQDLGILYLLSEYFKSLRVHASTQLNTHNKGQIAFLKKLNVERVNLARELNINEIKTLTINAHKNNILTEVFVHGSYCISFSGICYMSSIHGGNSGNRGRCSQPCRDKYIKTSQGKDYPLNLKDNSAYFDLDKLANAKVDSLKIEGRIKGFEYVYTIVNAWRKQIHYFNAKKSLLTDNSELYKVFNRDFSNSFLNGNINKDMFIDNPMTYSSKYLSKTNSCTWNNETTKQKNLYKEKNEIRNYIKTKIDKYSTNKLPLSLIISGACGTPLKISIKTSENSFEVISSVNLTNTGKEELNLNLIQKKLNRINDTEYTIKNIEYGLPSDLYLPFKEFSSIKKQILFLLNDSKSIISNTIIPILKNHKTSKKKPTLSVLISSYKDINIWNDQPLDYYFQLPNNFKNEANNLVNIFKKNHNLTPWFPSILIGDNYLSAVYFLEKIHPKSIVTNNTGIALEAQKRNIQWIAGANLNISNSYSLSCLKEKFNCYGAFLSSEISKKQMSNIKKPENFNLYYTIYQPMLLMTSRQCLFHQVSGCERYKIDHRCIEQCEKHSRITNLKNETFIIEKTKNNYHNIYHSSNILNTDVIADIPNIFSSLFIDLREIKTNTKIEVNKANLIELFKSHLNEDSDATEQIKKVIYHTNNTKYKKGI